MKLKNFFFETLMFFTISTSLIAGDAVRNGGGGVESDFTYAYVYLEEFLNRALLNKVELRLSKEEQFFLQRLLNNLRFEPEADKLFVFNPNRQDFQWKSNCSELKLAYTGNTIGNPIYLNQSIFYRDEKQNDGTVIRQRALSFSQIVQNVIHELGHHHQYQNHQWLDAAGAKVAKAALKVIEDEHKINEEVRQNKSSESPPNTQVKHLIVNQTLNVSPQYGYIFPHSIDPKTKPNFYFMPYHDANLYLIAPIASETHRLKLAFKSWENDSFMPFEARLEGILGAIQQTGGKNYFPPMSQPITPSRL